MGLVEPLKRLPELLRIRRNLYNTLVANLPDVFIGIDSPDFNLDLELKLRAAGVPTVHYVSPSVWAWRQGRIKKIRKAVDLMLALFPFEEAFYRENGVPVCCVGHPLADEFDMEPDTACGQGRVRPPERVQVLALLPGSRGGEVRRLGPVFLETAERCKEAWPDLTIVIPCAGPDRHRQLETLQKEQCPDLELTLVDGQSRTVMSAADCILMASGTASLEGMLLKKPMVVAYKMARLSYAIISRMVKAPYISLPNLLAGKALVPELLQEAVTADSLFSHVRQVMENESERKQLTEIWNSIHASLRRDANQNGCTRRPGVMRKVNLPFILEEDAIHTRVAGVDEAGRGPLAGDVVAAAVILDHTHPFDRLTDSKKLTPTQRTAFPLSYRKRPLPLLSAVPASRKSIR